MRSNAFLMLSPIVSLARLCGVGRCAGTLWRNGGLSDSQASLIFQDTASRIPVEPHAPAREVSPRFPEVVPEFLPLDLLSREQTGELVRIDGPRHGGNAVFRSPWGQYIRQRRK